MGGAEGKRNRRQETGDRQQETDAPAVRRSPVSCCRSPVSCFFILLAAACAGSWSTHFRPLDPRFAAGPLHRDPDVFVDRVPTRRYLAVGAIEVRAPSSQRLDAFLERAIPEARARGCELLVARHLHLGVVRGPVFVAQTQTFGGTVSNRPGGVLFGTDEPPRTRREFVCGVYERA